MLIENILRDLYVIVCFFNSCTPMKYQKYIENGKASDIPIIVIKKRSTIITEHICGIMNNFIEFGIFPF